MENKLEGLLEELLKNRDHVRISVIGKIYREGMPPEYRYEVIAPRFKGACYPEFTQNDTLVEAFEYLLKD